MSEQAMFYVNRGKIRFVFDVFFSKMSIILKFFLRFKRVYNSTVILNIQHHITILIMICLEQDMLNAYRWRLNTPTQDHLCMSAQRKTWHDFWPALYLQKLYDCSKLSLDSNLNRQSLNHLSFWCRPICGILKEINKVRL